jgi:hypothetical protein
MHGRTTIVLFVAALSVVVGCKSGSANADEVLSERTKRAEGTDASQARDQDGEGEDSPSDEGEQGGSKSVIRLFDEDEVDDSAGGPVEIGGASDDSVKLTVDQSSCEAFASSMRASVEKLDTACEIDADCAVLALPCALGCGRAVRAYSNLDQVEEFAAQYLEECPNCRKMCALSPDSPVACVDGACVARPANPAKGKGSGAEAGEAEREETREQPEDAAEDAGRSADADEE